MRFDHSLKYALLYRLFLFWEDFDLAGRYWISFQICYRRRCLVDYYQKFTNTRISGKTFTSMLSIYIIPFSWIRISNQFLTNILFALPGSFWFNVIPRGFFTIAWFLYGIIFLAQAALSNIPWKVIVLPFSAAVSAQINVMWFLSQTSKYVSIS